MGWRLCFEIMVYDDDKDAYVTADAEDDALDNNDENT